MARMLLRILREALFRRKRRVAVAVVAVLVGSSLAAALLTLASDVSDKVSRELKAYGANILAAPKAAGALGAGDEGSYLDESELVKLKTIFWRNNIVGFAPFLSLMVEAGPSGERAVLTGTWFDKELTLPPGTRITSTYSGPGEVSTGERFRTGVRSISPWWKVEGDWVADTDPEGALVGSALAERLRLSPGDSLEVRRGERGLSIRVKGILSTGGLEENQLFVSLPSAQRLMGIEKGASRVLVSALVTPKEKIPKSIRGKKPEEMTPKEYETWYCTPLLESIALQVEEVVSGAEAGAIRQISEAEGAFVSRIELLMALVAVVALVASALAVTSTMTTTVIERRPEIGLMKALGADNGQVALLFMAEAGLIGLFGGTLGYLAGVQVARVAGAAVFGTSPSANLVLLPVTLAIALIVALLSSVLPVRSAVRVQPATLMKAG